MLAIAQHIEDQTPTAIRHALALNGYLPIPVSGKRPLIVGWQKIQPTVDIIDEWEISCQHEKNTGILAGEVVAIDIDAPDANTAEKLITALYDINGAAHAPCRTGKAPKCLFVFRAMASRKKVATPVYIVNGQKCQVEVLGTGQQFVAYGIHPDTQQPYTWTSGDPLTVPLSELPEITPEQVDQYLTDAEGILAALGHPEKKASPRPAQSNTGDTFWNRVNAAALANTDAWVTALFSSARKEAGTGAWRITSKDLGRGLEEDISIHSDGIQDFGEERGLTAIDLVREYGGAGSVQDAAKWLCERLGRDPASLGWEIKQPVSLSFGKRTVAMEAANDDDADDDSVPLPTAGGLPLSLCAPVGMVGEIAKFITSCARFPSPHLSLASALAFVSALIGRRYKGPTGLRSNLYIIGLAESGFGKDITLRAVQNIAASTKMGAAVAESLFADKLSSLPGLANKLRRAPACLVQQDEFGKFLKLYMGNNAPAHREEVATALLELTGAAAGFFGGQEKATGNIPRIQNPCLSVHGISTPSTFWGALGNGSVDDGLLARFVLIDAGNSDPKKVRRPQGSIENIPATISHMVWDLLGGSSGAFQGPFLALNAKSDSKPFPIMTVEYASDEVDNFFEEFDDSMRAMKKKIAPEYHPLANRVGENAARLAMIVAVGANPREPIITMEIQHWANTVAEHSFRLLIKGAKDSISDNPLSAEYLKVRKVIARAGKKGLRHKELVRTLKGSIRDQRLDEVLGALSIAGEAQFATARADSGQKMTRWWAQEFLPSDAEQVEGGT